MCLEMQILVWLTQKGAEKAAEKDSMLRMEAKRQATAVSKRTLCLVCRY